MKSTDITTGEHYLVSTYRDWTSGVTVRRMVALSTSPFVNRSRFDWGASKMTDLTDLIPAADLPGRRYASLRVNADVKPAPSFKPSADWTVGVLMVEVTTRDDGSTIIPVGARACIVPVANIKTGWDDGTAAIRAAQRERTAKENAKRDEREARERQVQEAADTLGLTVDPSTWSPVEDGAVQRRGGSVLMTVATFTALAQRIGADR